MFISHKSRNRHKKNTASDGIQLPELGQRREKDRHPDVMRPVRPRGRRSVCKCFPAFSPLRPQESWVTMPGLPSFQVSLEKEKRKEPQPNPERGFPLSGNSLLYQRGCPVRLLHGFQGDRDIMPAFPVPLGPTYNSYSRELARLQILRK